jgi:hypothetical protein
MPDELASAVDTTKDDSEPDSGYWRLEDQIRWYDARSRRSQLTYKWLKAAQIVVAALVPVSALVFPQRAVIPGLLGAVILILEGFQELGAYQRNWTKYRGTFEALRREKFLFVGQAGSYQWLKSEDARKELVHRVETLVSQENAQWSSYMDAQRAREAKAGEASPPTD